MGVALIHLRFNQTCLKIQMRKKILIIQPNSRAYRVPFFKNLSKALGSFTLLHFGDPKFENHPLINEVIGSRNSLGGFFWIKNLSKIVKRHDVIIAMNDIHWSNLFFTPFFTRIPFIAWGHGKSKSKVVNSLRERQGKKIAAYIVYGEEGKKELIDTGIKANKIFISPNTVAVENHQDTSIYNKNSFLYVGRLQRRKKLDVFLRSYSNLNLKSFEVKLRIVGNGEDEKIFLMNLAKKLEILPYIEFIEGTTDNIVLAKYFKEAYAYISPGAVGLGALHSFAFGVPVLTMKDKNHGPEFFNVINNETGIIADNFDDFCKAVLNILQGNTHTVLGSNAFKHYTEKRQISNMVDGFEKAIDFVPFRHKS